MESHLPQYGVIDQMEDSKEWNVINVPVTCIRV